MRVGSTAVCLSFGLISAVSAVQFKLTDTLIGHDFLHNWKWETFDDPTHGRVNYVDQSAALASNLTYASSNKFVMRADDSKVVQSGARGRDSIRITSQKAYSDSVIVLDLAHMPEGISTWPAFWTISQKGPWPHGGEIDIIEGVNENEQNLASLHTTPGCTMPSGRMQTGSTVSNNCDTSVDYNQGCGTSFVRPASYGSHFNDLGGGWYVTQRTASGINIWFWSRSEGNVPHAVKFGSDNISPDPMWGSPDAQFTFGTCDYQSHFDTHEMIFDLTFCGDWAGSAYTKSGYKGTCTDYVNNNPQAFSKAYWEINSLRVYTPKP